MKNNFFGKYLIFALLIITFLVLVYPQRAEATDISVSGSWSETINADDLIDGAGSDLLSTYQNSGGDISLTLSNGSSNWRVDVKRSDTIWSSNFSLGVRRVSSGSGGTVSGGTTYLTIRTIDSEFFTGSGSPSGIDLQLRLSGVSIAIPVDIYSTTITYTVVDI